MFSNWMRLYRCGSYTNKWKISQQQEQKHIVCFKIANSDQYYVALTLYALENVYRECLKHDHGCNILHSRSFNDSFVPFQQKFLLK